MMNNKVNTDAQLQRMKALMNYGVNESKQPAYSSVEYSKVAADGKLYGIVREGTNYFIKVAKDPKGKLVSENFDYINGFRNRNNNKFNSFASAQRYFGEKLMNINENVDDVQKRVIAEAWDIDAKKEVIEEQTKKVQKEIARQRQIMENAVRISEGKKQCCDMPGCECPAEQKVETIKKNPSAPFVTIPTDGVGSIEKNNIKKSVKESSETPLTSRENPEYMDRSHGTEIGNAAPFCKPKKKAQGAVADAESSQLSEGEAMYNTDDLDTPNVGVGEKGDASPFTKMTHVNESLDDLDDELEDDVEDDDLLDGDAEDFEDEDVENEYEVELDSDLEENELGARMDGLENKLDSILDVINNLKYDEDEELYDDLDDEDDEEETEFEVDMEDEDDLDDEDIDFDDEDDDLEDEDDNVMESRSYRRARMNEANRLNDFGKHPAYQKKVMTLPANTNPMRDGQYDMNDSSVESEMPYGQKKGNNAPFSKSVKQTEDAIVEAVYNMLKKKLN